MTLQSTGRVMAGAIACGMLLAGCTSSSAAPRAELSAKRQTIDKVWHRDPRAVACVPENLALTCHYLHKGMHVAVAYAPNGRAVEMIVNTWPHHAAAEWTFLKSEVPSGAHLVSCKDVAHSVGGGTAHACIYHFKQSVIVAYFPHANDPTFGGLVAYDYAAYQDVKQ